MAVPLVAVYVAGWGVVVGSFAFCVHRRKHQQALAQPTERWFGRNEARDNYYDLVESSSPDNLLKPALVRRAMACVRRISQLAEEQGPLQVLLRTGAVGDDLWAEWQVARAELEAETKEIREEAEAFKPGWGEQIMKQAVQMAQREMEKEVEAKAERAAAEEEKERRQREEREKAEAAVQEAAERARVDKIREELLRQEEKEKKSRQGKQLASGKKSKKR